MILAAALLTGLAAPATAGEQRTDGPVVGGSFGMVGADYYGDLRSRMPFTQEAPPLPIGISDIEGVRAARRRAGIAQRRALIRPAVRGPARQH